MTDPAIPPAAQVVYTTNFLTSPQFIGAVVAAIVFGAQRGLGVEIDVQTQGMIAMGVGWALGWAVKWFFPNSDGRLGFAAPAAWSTPSPVNIPAGTASVVTVPALLDEVQVATVTPIGVGVQRIGVTAAKDETARSGAAPMAVTIGKV